MIIFMYSILKIITLKVVPDFMSPFGGQKKNQKLNYL